MSALFHSYLCGREATEWLILMKVIHLISGGDSGGAKTHVLSLLQNLNKTITAQLVCFRDGPFADEARAMGIPTMICGGNNVFRVRRQLTDYIRQGGYELIHCQIGRASCRERV